MMSAMNAVMFVIAGVAVCALSLHINEPKMLTLPLSFIGGMLVGHGGMHLLFRAFR